MFIDSAGTVFIAKTSEADGTSTSFQLSSTGFEQDDHNNGALEFLPDGRIIAFYCKHPDTAQRYRISTSAEDISAWGTEVALTATEPTYSNPVYLSESGKVYVFYRSGTSGDRITKRLSASSPFSSWGSEVNWITGTGARPYVKWCSNGTNRIDFLFTNCHPNEGASSVWHAYMQLDAGVEKFYKSDGTLIGTSLTPTDATQIYDGTTKNAWVWDITYGSDGRPRVLFVKYESGTDHRYMFSRWTSGSAWTTPVQIVAGGTYLYAAEGYYSGGLCFDQADPNRVYASVQVSSAWEVQDWRTSDDGATWAKSRDMSSSGGSTKNCRPISPRNATAALRCLWWSGTYTTFLNYSTAVVGRG